MDKNSSNYAKNIINNGQNKMSIPNYPEQYYKLYINSTSLGTNHILNFSLYICFEFQNLAKINSKFKKQDNVNKR